MGLTAGPLKSYYRYELANGIITSTITHAYLNWKWQLGFEGELLIGLVFLCRQATVTVSLTVCYPPLKYLIYRPVWLLDQRCDPFIHLSDSISGRIKVK